ncbi:FAD-dependent oxidoreductase [Chloroflexota bacterium]
MIYHQVLVIGGGLAGLRAAIEVKKKGLDVALLSQVYPIRSHSTAAQGGINASLANVEEGKDDNWEKHAYDTVLGSDFLADQDAVEIMTREAPATIYELEHWGAPFSRTGDGRINQRPFGGAGFPRACYAADKTGRVLLHTLFEQATRRDIRLYPERMVMMLAVEEDICRGAVAINIRNGQLEVFGAEAVVLATGGYGRIYARSTNSLVNTGSGMALAYYAGIALEDMEFVQFHPTSLVGTNILMTEAARGEGGYLINNRGERFMKNYTPAVMELAPRDIVARAIQTEIQEGRGFENDYVLLDLRHLGKQHILEHLPEIRLHAINFTNIDPIDEPIPIQPAQHYSMGGADCNIDGETEVRGFFAAGECACVSVHGANRLGGNSLLETVTLGRRAGAKAAQYVTGKAKPGINEPVLQQALTATGQRIAALMAGQGKEDPDRIRAELGRVMTDNAGVFRDCRRVQEAIDKILQLKERYQNLHPVSSSRIFNLDLVRTYELRGMLDIAEVISRGALARQESRGSHYRLDFKDRDDTRWLKHTIAHYTPEGPRLDYRDVRLTRWQPKVRKY